MKNLFIFLLLGFLFPDIMLAQIDSLYEAFNESIEEDNGLSEIFEELQKNPFNINTISKEELRIFPFLNESQIDSILVNRPFSQKRQVRQILDKDSYKFLRPFFIVKPLSQIFKLQITQRNFLPMYTVKGIKEKKFLGNEYDNYSKIRFQTSESISGGFLIQKDLGENEIYDHYSGFLQWKSHNIKIILGNYQIQFGLGLIMDSPYAMQKSIFTLAPVRTKNSGGRHYLTSAEFTGLNGIFTQYSLINNISANIFYANTQRDGNIDNSNQYVTAINNSGYHRTEREYDKKDLIKEKTFGGNIKYTLSDNIETGLCVATMNYNPTLVYNLATQSEKELRRNHFKFSGDNINVYSVFIHSHFEKFEFSSEISTNRFNNFSHSHNVLFPTPNGGVGFKWWYISKHFQSPFGHSFASGSNFPQAKQGFYVGLQHRLNEDISCSSYWSTEKDLWRTILYPCHSKHS